MAVELHQQCHLLFRICTVKVSACLFTYMSAQCFILSYILAERYTENHPAHKKTLWGFYLSINNSTIVDFHINIQCYSPVAVS